MSETSLKTIQVACAIIRREDKIFIARRKPEKAQGGKWEFPGGKIEEGETIEDCLTREFLEEFGVPITVGERCGSNIHAYDSFTIELIGLYCQIDSDAFSLSDHDQTAWVARDELKNYDLAPADIPLIDLIY